MECCGRFSVFNGEKRFELGEVKEFLSRTIIVLIPIVVGLEVVMQFHPISLCILPYKVLTKVVVNQL